MTQHTPSKILYILKIVFMISICICLLIYKTNIPRVIVVHSYNLNLTSVQKINDGIKRIFAGKSNFTVHWQYMNTKSNLGIGYKQRAGLNIRKFIADLQPSVLIAVHEEAQDFVARFYLDDPTLSIVFCGIKGDLHDYSYDTATNVTGILEKLPLDAIQQIVPSLALPTLAVQNLKIITLGDLSPEVKLDERYILKHNWAPQNLIDAILVGNFDDWKRAVLASNQRAHCLYVVDYHQIEDQPGSGRYVPAQKVVEWTEQNSKIPVIGSNMLYVKDGGRFALAPSAYEQGEIAAKYALRILKGENPSSLPVQTTNQFLISIRDSSTQSLSRLPSIYEAFARGIDAYFEARP